MVDIILILLCMGNEQMESMINDLLTIIST